jgi:hypothetical protein
MNIIAPYNFSGEIWITEIGFPTRGIYPGGINEKNYPEYIVKTLSGFAARNLRVNFWYEVFDKYNRDEAPSRIDASLYFGLAYPDFTRKRGAAAFALCGRYIPGREYRPELPERGGLPPSLTALYFRGKSRDAAGNGGASTLILWNDRGLAPVRLSLPGTERQLHDIAGGGERSVPETAEFLLGKTPLFFTWHEEPGKVPVLTASGRER